ncbi:hypothetical protein [Haloferula sp.]|uniref:hypothetical protein n=1 Tax=Haloferula sp. TaxID=2497595 RepID=UPI00329D8FDB
MDAEAASEVFGSDYIDPKEIIRVYEGLIESDPEGEFRFAGVFDDVICAIVNKKLVFYVSRHEGELRYKPDEKSNRRKSADKNELSYLAYGDYIALEKGGEVTLVLGEIPGGNISGELLVQLKEHEYELLKHCGRLRTREGGPSAVK